VRDPVEAIRKQALPDLADTADFQDWSSWRPLVATVLDEVSRQTQQHIVSPQSVLNRDYFDEIRTALDARGQRFFHILLDAPEHVLRSRIEASDEAQVWRLQHLPIYMQARSWMLDSADLVVDTSATAPPEVARLILDAMPVRSGRS
jgi:hypothetical protein